MVNVDNSFSSGRGKYLDGFMWFDDVVGFGTSYHPRFTPCSDFSMACSVVFEALVPSGKLT